MRYSNAAAVRNPSDLVMWAADHCAGVSVVCLDDGRDGLAIMLGREHCIEVHFALNNGPTLLTYYGAGPAVEVTLEEAIDLVSARVESWIAFAEAQVAESIAYNALGLE